jgi:hypothetical protein
VIIRYSVQTDSRWDQCAEYAIRLLLEGIGVAGIRVGPASSADLVYSVERPPDLHEKALWVRAADLTDWNSSNAKVVWSSELPVLCGSRQQSMSGDPDHIVEDIVYSTYATVTGALERDSPRNAWGVPIGRSSPLNRNGLLEFPVIAMYCSHLEAMLIRRQRAEIECVPRWPMGKRYAVVLSHDVDKPFTRAPWAFYVRRFGRNVAQRAPGAALHGLMQMAKVAAVTRMATLKDPIDDPNFCFEGWIDLERSLSAASCFYVAPTSSGDPGGSRDDVNYDFRHPHILAQLRRALEAGWEVGLHASINARRNPSRLHDERMMLEGALGSFPVRGVRHHYWALDSELPERTFWHQVDAGLTYDSSLGLDDAPGFRRGMMWPFRPFDPERGEEVPILEVPPTLMDGSIFRPTVTLEAGRQLIEAHLGHVRRFGGAAVLDWHLEQLNPARLHGAGPVLRDVLTDLATDGDVYWAAPQQVVSWWETRHRLIQNSGRERDHA